MPKPIRSVPTPATSIIAICAKCGKKLGGGFGERERQSLAKALRQALHLPKPKHARVRIVETSCLKLCPKGAVAAVHSGNPGEILVIPRGTPLHEITRRLDIA